MIYLFNLLYSTIYSTFIKKMKFLYFLPVFIVWVGIIGLQYDVGTDYFSYLNIFNDENYLNIYFNKKEYIFFYFVKILKIFFKNGQSFFIMVSFLENILFYLFIKNLVKYKFLEIKDLWIFIFAFFSYGTVFYNQMNGIRQYFNIYLFSMAMIFSFYSQKIKYIFIFITGSYIHQSFLYLFPCYFYKIIEKALTKKFLLYLFLVVIISNFLPIPELVKKFIHLVPEYKHYIDKFTLDIINSKMKIVKFIFIPFYIESIYLLDKIEEKPKQWFLKLGIVSFAIRIFCLRTMMLNRIGEYFNLLSIFPICYLLIFYYRTNKKVKFLLLASMIIGLFLVKTLILPQKEYLYKCVLFYN